MPSIPHAMGIDKHIPELLQRMLIFFKKKKKEQKKPTGTKQLNKNSKLRKETSRNHCYLHASRSHSTCFHISWKRETMEKIKKKSRQ